MKFSLSALSCLLGVSPAFAQDVPAAHPCAEIVRFGGHDRSWSTDFDGMEARYAALPPKQRQDLEHSGKNAAALNVLCPSLKDDGYVDCGIMVDHLALKEGGLFKKEGHARWYVGDPSEPNMASDADAEGILSNAVCKLWQDRKDARSASVQRAADDRAALIRQREQAALIKQLAAENNAVHTFGQGLPTAPTDANPPAQAPSMIQSALSAVKQTVSDLTPEIISNNVGIHCGLNAAPDCACREWNNSGCSDHPEAPACRSTLASMCPHLGQ